MSTTEMKRDLLSATSRACCSRIYQTPHQFNESIKPFHALRERRREAFSSLPMQILPDPLDLLVHSPHDDTDASHEDKSGNTAEDAAPNELLEARAPSYREPDEENRPSCEVHCQAEFREESFERGWSRRWEWMEHDVGAFDSGEGRVKVWVRSMSEELTGNERNESFSHPWDPHP